MTAIYVKRKASVLPAAPTSTVLVYT